MRRTLAALLMLATLAALPVTAAEVSSKPAPPAKARPAAPAKSAAHAGPDSLLKPGTFTGLELRSIGPAMNSGRIIDLAVHPTQRATWYVAVACGGVWKTVNAGNTFTPIFDQQGVYSIGCVTVDPKNPLIVWVGTGENNSQRSVGYGDGVYKSEDGGKTWENVGLKASEHIGRIVIDPRDPNTVYVAAQGPLWADGGDRGLYKSVNGGKDWKKVLEISPRTGVSDLWYDPRNPDVLYAASYQRRRHVWAMLDGGPESAIYKSLDAGATWKKLKNGLPKEDMGRIGLAVSPADPDVIYAVIEAANKAGGTYRSTDAGANWEKVNDYVSPSAQYYNELIPDPKVVGRVYSMDTWMMVTEDGGKTWRRVGEKYKHVDNHALWIDPDDTRHLLAGCDGGLYDSFDRGANWRFFGNLPVTQFYKVGVDEAKPFYNVYGGTQDNNSLGGPSRTIDEPRHHEPGLVHHHRRRRLSEPGGPRGPERRLRHVAVRRAGPLRPQDRRADGHPAPAGRRQRAAALELGLAALHQPALAHPALLRGEPALPQRRPRRLVAGGQPRPHAADRPQQAQAHGAGLERGRGGQERLDLALRQHRGHRGVAAQGRPALRRHRRRAAPDQRGRRQDLAEDREVPRRARAVVRLARHALAARRQHALRHLRQPQAGRTSSPTCSRARTWAAPGPRSRRTCRRTGRSGRCSRTTWTGTCSSRAPSSACSSRTTAAGSGCSSRAACRRSA